jgi:hypothetical protein
MPVMVNGSLTKEIIIQLGLKKCDHLAPFSLSFGGGRFRWLMKKAVELNHFQGFKACRQNIFISHLQYVDNTLCVGFVIESLWTMKAILRDFEMLFRLKIPIMTSSLTINVNTFYPLS